jgi:hypothetical protein
MALLHLFWIIYYKKETVDITLDTQIFYRYHKFTPQVMVRTHSAMLLQFFRIPYLNILELVTILIKTHHMKKYNQNTQNAMPSLELFLSFLYFSQNKNAMTMNKN